MSELDIRWKQRFTNFKKAYSKLQEAVESIRRNKNKGYWLRSSEEPFVYDLLKDGVIQRFEYTHELAWNVMKDYLIYQGISGIMGSRDAIKQAFNKGLIKDGQLWIDMIQDRIKTVHTYDEEAAEQVEKQIISVYFDLFSDFYQTMKNLQ